MSAVRLESVPRRREASLTRDELTRDFVSKNMPVVVTEASFWSGDPFSIDFLKQKYGHLPLGELKRGIGGETGILDHHLEEFPTLGDYLSRMQIDGQTTEDLKARPTGGSPFSHLEMRSTTRGLPYLTNLSVLRNFPEIERRFSALPAFGSNWTERIDKDAAVGEIFIGPRSTSYGELHFDRHFMFVATYQLAGQKKWWLFPPGDSKYLYPMPYWGDWFPHFSPLNPESPDLESYPLFANANGLSTVLEAGDVLFCPAQWWHYTANLTDSVSIAVRVVNRFNAHKMVADFAVSSSINVVTALYRTVFLKQPFTLVPPFLSKR